MYIDVGYERICLNADLANNLASELNSNSSQPIINVYVSEPTEEAILQVVNSEDEPVAVINSDGSAQFSSINIDGIDLDIERIQNFYSYKDIITCDGESDTYGVEHNLNSKDVIIQMYDLNDSANNVELCGYQRLDDNNIDVVFLDPPEAGKQYRILIMKI